MMKNYEYSGDLEIYEQILKTRENVTRNFLFVNR